MVESRDAIEHGGCALNWYLKLCQQRKVVAEELLIAEIAPDPVCERTTSIDCSLCAPPLDGGQWSFDLARSVFGVPFKFGKLLEFLHRTSHRWSLSVLIEPIRLVGTIRDSETEKWKVPARIAYDQPEYDSSRSRQFRYRTVCSEFFRKRKFDWN
jgi:hypothetical protein